MRKFIYIKKQFIEIFVNRLKIFVKKIIYMKKKLKHIQKFTGPIRPSKKCLQSCFYEKKITN